MGEGMDFGSDLLAAASGSAADLMKAGGMADLEKLEMESMGVDDLEDLEKESDNMDPEDVRKKIIFQKQKEAHQLQKKKKIKQVKAKARKLKQKAAKQNEALELAKEQL